MQGKKTLIIGAKGFSGVDCYDWSDKQFPDIADYHNVIINAVSLTKNPIEQIIKREIRSHLLELLITRGTLFAIGCPYIFISAYKGSNYDWNPIPLTITNSTGSNFIFEDSTFEEYFKNIRNFSYYFEKPLDSIDGMYSYEYSIKHSVKNRHGKYLAGKIAFNRYTIKEVPRSSSGYSGTKKVLSERIESGNFYFLPSPTQISDIEAINFILIKYLNIYQVTPPPEWAEPIEVPGLVHPGSN